MPIELRPADAGGRGTGRALTEHALDQPRAPGCTLAVVSTGGDPGHAPARARHEAAGFTGLPLGRSGRFHADEIPSQSAQGVST